MNKRQKVTIFLGMVLILLMGMFPPWNYVYKFPSQKSVIKIAGFNFLLTPSTLPIISNATKQIGRLKRQLQTTTTQLDTVNVHFKRWEEKQEIFKEKQLRRMFAEKGNVTQLEALEIRVEAQKHKLPEFTTWQARRDSTKEELNKLRAKLDSLERELGYIEPQINYNQLLLQWTMVAISVLGLFLIFRE